MTLAGVVAFFSGSRGPIVAGLAGLAVLVAFGRQTLGKSVVRLAMASGLFLLVLASSLSLAPEGSLNRVESFARGDYGPSELYRVQALRSSWSYIPSAPLGLGWGGFGTHVNPLNGLGRQYAHNLLAEVTIESGWLSGAYTLLILLCATVAGWSRTRFRGGQMIFIGLVFYVINAMVSGDVNDNRPVFMLVTAALMLLELPEVKHG
jgi:O-antigen ligase